MSDISEFSVKHHTRAPLRHEFKAEFNVPAQQLFDVVSDHHAVANWVPLMKAVSMEHRRSSSGECGVGSIRHCTLHGMGGIDETILWWEPPHGYAFRVNAKSKMMMPTKDHVSVMLIESRPDGGSNLTWQHYFNWEGLVMRHMTAIMFPMMMKKALSNIRNQLGQDASCASHGSANCGTSTCPKSCCK